MKILITGGCGFLGSSLAFEALSRNLELVTFDNLSRAGSIQNLYKLQDAGPALHLIGDVRNFQEVENAILEHRPDVVFHLAGQVAMTTSIENPRQDFEINTLGTINVLEALRRHLPECGLIYSSTNKVYGDLASIDFIENETRYVAERYKFGFDETLSLNFHSPYGCSKGAADQYIQDYSRLYGMKTVVFRHSSMYGINQVGTFDQGWIAWFIKCALDQKYGKSASPFTIAGNGKQVRDLLEQRDMVALYYTVADKIDILAGRVFNVGGGVENSMSLLEILREIGENIDFKLSFDRISARYSDQKVFIADIRSISSATGWTPKVTCKKGVAELIRNTIKSSGYTAPARIVS